MYFVAIRSTYFLELGLANPVNLELTQLSLILKWYRNTHPDISRRSSTKTTSTLSSFENMFHRTYPSCPYFSKKNMDFKKVHLWLTGNFK